jgi:hypothetical protein
MLRLAYRSGGGEWQGMWASRGGVQAGAHECGLRGNESGPMGGDRGSECGAERAVECRPSPVRMQAATQSFLGRYTYPRYDALTGSFEEATRIAAAQPQLS